VGLALTIRLTRARDHDDVLRLVREAFSNEGRDAQDEVDIVVEMWARGCAPDGLDLVAVDEDVVIGHVMASRVPLGEREALGIAPLSVMPARQRSGIGSVLMREIVSCAEAAGRPLIVVLGEPRYRRFGFERAAPRGIMYPPVGPESDAFQVLRLSGYDRSWRGDFTYCWELGTSGGP
jgi:putative acetyltransferase